MKGVTTQQGREALNQFKMEAANEVGVNLKQGYNGDLTAREVGSVGGQMVKKMIAAYKTAGSNVANQNQSQNQ
ncbi:MAG: alpha/beta-type small acid-soluble spore protein [Hominimerdicola sp.]